MKEMWKGNHAIAEGALRGGLQFYAGYPITPQTEVLEYLSYRMPELGRIFVQAENEIAAISMVYGTSATGLRSMTGSSGPGMSLKQEGISYLCYNDLPCVLVNVQRWGAALGTLDSSQTDYLRDTRGGGHGDYRLIIYAPNTIQETVTVFVVNNFNYAMTGGQMSWTTIPDQVTTTSVHGREVVRAPANRSGFLKSLPAISRRLMWQGGRFIMPKRSTRRKNMLKMQ